MGKKRMSICNNCLTRTNNICDKSKGGCGCILKLKVISPGSNCPKGYWKSQELINA
jgi:hypothetical protein